MPNAIKINWDTVTAFSTLTNLHSLASGNIWQSGEFNEADPMQQVVRISYSLVFNATPVAGDRLIFYWSIGDEHASEIWTGGIGTSESEISAAASIAEVQAACPIVHSHAWKTSHGTTFKGHFDVWNFGPSWQLLIEASGEALSSSGNVLHYRYGTPEVQ